MRRALSITLGLVSALLVAGCREEPRPAAKTPDPKGAATKPGAEEAKAVSWPTIDPKAVVEPVIDGAKVLGKKGPDDPLHIAFVTNQVHEFWFYADAGCRKAASELKNVKAEVIMPEPRDVKIQREKVDALLSIGVDGIAISPINPESTNDLLDEAAKKTILICHDSDAPKSKRVLYLGTLNFNAGQAAGKAFLEACPEGGKVCLFVANRAAANARERADGFIDATKGKVTVIKEFYDDGDQGNARRNAEDCLAKYGSEIVGMVGLYAYNGPAIASAIKESASESAKKMKVVAFDEQTATLDGIRDGVIYATVVQQPYQFGYQSVKILAALARGDKSVLPAGFPTNRIIDIPARTIKKDDVEAFRAECKRLLGK